MSLVLVQCGDGWENQTRILALARHYREAGHRPRIIVYSPTVGALFLREGFEVVTLNVTRLPAAEAEPEIEFNLADLRLLDERIARASGKPGPYYKERKAARTRALAAAARLDDIGPEAFAVWNGYTGLAANVFRQYKSRRGLPGGFIERGLVGNSTFFDRIGVNGAATIARGGACAYSEAEIDASTERQAGRILDRFPELGRERFLEASAGRREKIVFVPLQVQLDSNIVLHSPTVRSMRRLVLEAIALARSLGPDWSVVVRPHPEELPRMRLNLPRLPGLSVDSRNSLGAWLDRAGVVLTVNSTVGLEAAIRGAKVVCLGEGIYCREPFVLRDEAAGEGLREAIAVCSSSAVEERRESVIRYLATLFDRHQLVCDPETGRPLASGWVEMHQPADGAASVPPSQSAPGTGAELRWQTAIAPYRDSGGPCLVDVFLRPQNFLFLTYRKTRETITRAHIVDTLRRQLGPGCEFELRRMSPQGPAPDPRKAKIAVVDRDEAFECQDYDVVIDQYGEPHLSFLSQAPGMEVRP